MKKEKSKQEDAVRDDEAHFALEVFRASMPAQTTHHESSGGWNAMTGGTPKIGETKIIREEPSAIHKLATEVLMKRLNRK